MISMIKQKILSEERRPLFKKLLEEKAFVRAIEAHNGISALIGERACSIENGAKKEFNALWISSLTDSVAKGYPDEEIISIDSRLDTVNQILNVTTKPLMYDGDTGGFPEQLNYLIKQLERLGVSAVVIEDKKYPKSNSLLHSASHNMEDIAAFVEKIRYAKMSQRSREFMLIARIESFIVNEPIEMALERAQAYIEAGADGIMIHSKSDTPDHILRFAERYQKLSFPGERKALMCVPTTYNTVYEQDLTKSGFNIVLYANHLFRASFTAMQKVCSQILASGRAAEAEDMCASLKQILEPVGSLRTFSAEYEVKPHEMPKTV
jgi:phosphoenolpyruvate mutase